ncbi:MAG: type III-A CRISPR-associated RAMP protein Csm3 [Nitrospirae bacterium]|nr:type III-A CRISPR-associated RAMP protein Csm3 [Nitrospirota bacterium]
MTLRRIIRLEGKIVLKSGLHIGSGDMEMHIGGTDSPVIKHPHTLEPYIPGSSLKGKVRSLMELESGLVPFNREEGGIVSIKTLRNLEKSEDKDALKQKAEAILKIFGCSGAESEDMSDIGPTRVSFSDCYLNSEWKVKARKNRWPLTEEKSENSIDRITGTAKNPRFIERIPEGTEFDFSLSFKVLQNGDETLFDELLRGLKLLELDSIGGNGSRGYGRIEFRELKRDGESATLNL